MSDSFLNMISMLEFEPDIVHVKDESRICSDNVTRLSLFDREYEISKNVQGSSAEVPRNILSENRHVKINLTKNCSRDTASVDLVWAPLPLKHPNGGLVYAPARICQECEVKLVPIAEFSEDTVPVEFFGLPVQFHYYRVQRNKLKPFYFTHPRKIYNSNNTQSPAKQLVEMNGESHSIPYLSPQSLQSPSPNCPRSNANNEKEWSNGYCEQLRIALRAKWSHDIAGFIMNNVIHFAERALSRALASEDSNSVEPITSSDANTNTSPDSDISRQQQTAACPSEQSGAIDLTSSSPATASRRTVIPLASLCRPAATANSRKMEVIQAGDFVMYEDTLLRRRVVGQVLEVVPTAPRHPLRLDTDYLLHPHDSCQRVEGKSAVPIGRGRPLREFSLVEGTLAGAESFQQSIDRSAAVLLDEAERDTGGYSVSKRRRPLPCTPPLVTKVTVGAEGGGGAGGEEEGRVASNVSKRKRRKSRSSNLSTEGCLETNVVEGHVAGDVAKGSADLCGDPVTSPVTSKVAEAVAAAVAVVDDSHLLSPGPGAVSTGSDRGHLRRASRSSNNASYLTPPSSGKKRRK